jgi:hypothetical protein
MPRECFQNYPNTTGFPCILCEDSEECKLIKIPEGSKIIFYVNGDKQTEAEAMEDMKIYPNTVTMIDGILVCTDSNIPAQKISEMEYRIYCWLQDCMYIRNGGAYESASNAD